MTTTIKLLEQIFDEATLKAFPVLKKSLTPFKAEISKSSLEKFGDYQFNSCMKLSRELKKNPREIAEIILKEVKENELVQKLDIAGAGFINITLKPKYLEQKLEKILKKPRLGIEKKSQETVVIDFSSPNTAKEMHVGHLRSTIIGDCLARLFEFLGDRVIRLNHIGDWGTAFGMLIAFMKKEAPHILEGKEKTDLPKLMSLYKSSKELFDRDPEFKKASQLEVVALQSGNSTTLAAWELICDISRKGYQEIYDLLSIKIEERGESFYNPFLKNIVLELEKKGLIEVSDGAKCLFVEGFKNREGEPLPLMIQKSDGGYNYDTTDMAAIRQRIFDEKADRIIYVTDAGQGQHFEMIFKAAEKAGYLEGKKIRLDHVPFGLVLGTDGKKFKTRSGDTEKLIDLITKAIFESKKILLEKNPEMVSEADQQELNKLAKALGISAIKYADLSCNRVGDYTFSYERMLRFEGNTAAFLLYSYVRIHGIKRKKEIESQQIKKEALITLKEKSEIALGLHLTQFDETIENLANELLPNRLTDFLFVLAEKFNAFYRDCPVLNSSEEESRLLICEACAMTMKKGLEILGLEVVDRM